MKNKDITKVITQGRAFKSSSFLLKVISKEDLSDNGRNVAILCSKKVFKTAVVRNKARRRIRAAFSTVKKEFGMRLVYKDEYLVFTAYDSVLTVGFASLQIEMENILKKGGMLKS